MKKLVLIPIIALFLSGAGLVATVASYPVEVNGEALNATVLNQNGTTYLPLKAVGQALGADVSWNGKGVEVQTVDVDKLKESCVMIYAGNSTKTSQGSAVCWDYGKYLTAYHVVDNGQTNITTSKGDKFTAGAANPFIDIATLEAPDTVNPVKIGDSNEVKVGDKVIIIGSPDQEENAVLYATVTKSAREIAVTGLINGGGSGAAVFDIRGNLIGIVIEVDEELNETYITPINAIRKML